jgi:hypothetical protein
VRAPSNSSGHSPNERILLEISKVVSSDLGDASCCPLVSRAFDRYRSGVVLQGMSEARRSGLSVRGPNLRIIVIMSAVLMSAAASGGVQAQSMLEIAAGIKFCKTLTDDAQRLKCFDGLFTEKQQPPAAQSQPTMSWSIEESKSPIDDSPQVTGMLHADGSTDGPGLTPPTMLVLRCQEKKTEAYLAKPFTF